MQQVVAVDGPFTASACSDGTIKLWICGPRFCTLIGKLTGHKEEISILVFSPNKITLVSGDINGHIMFWDVPDGKCICSLFACTCVINSMVFSADGTTLLSTGWNGTRKLWRVSDGVCIGMWNRFDPVLEHARNSNIIRTWNLSER